MSACVHWLGMSRALFICPKLVELLFVPCSFPKDIPKGFRHLCTDLKIIVVPDYSSCRNRCKTLNRSVQLVIVATAGVSMI